MDTEKMEWRYCFVAVKGRLTPLEVCKFCARENFFDKFLNRDKDTKGSEEFESLCIKKSKETK